MKPTILAVALLTALSATPAVSAVYSIASLNNYTISLVDLDINDGIAPSISFQEGFQYINNFVSGPNRDEKLINGQNIDPISVTSSNGENTANASITGASITNFNMQVSGNTLTAVPYLGEFNYGYYAFASSSNYFTLSANTSVNFTLTSLNYLQTTEGTGSNTDAFTSSSIEVRGFNVVDGNIVNGQSNNDRYRFNTMNFDGGVDFTLEQLTLLSVTLENNFNSQLNGVLFSNVHTAGNVYFESPPSAIPVPAALPLMASALGFFGIGARTRKSFKI